MRQLGPSGLNTRLAKAFAGGYSKGRGPVVGTAPCSVLDNNNHNYKHLEAKTYDPNSKFDIELIFDCSVSN